MERMGAASPVAEIGIWLGAVLVSGVAGLVVLGVTYDEFLDCSNPEIHESANTTLGWTIAFVASALPLAVATWLAGGLRRGLTIVALVVALLSLGFWQWVLDADCEWYATGGPAGAPILF
ncbi:hypothetical protein ACE2AJ_05535 [Aquihabitans daechungensis]|uniref:hypothetical protein n=1 Tax=Aquihabitans daechungensis TaxID=1052257 RepID=UPI003B9F43C2